MDERYQQFSRAELIDALMRIDAVVSALQARFSELEGRLAAAKRNSSNSSKPPSSDIVKPKPKIRRRKGMASRRPGCWLPKLHGREPLRTI